MKMSFKIRTKIILSLAAVCAVMVIICAFLAVGVNGIAKSDSHLYTNETMGVNYSGSMRDDVNDLQLTVHDYGGLLYQLQVTGKTMIPEFDVTDSLSAVSSAFTAYQKTVDTDKNKNLAATFKQCLQNYTTNVIDPISAAIAQKNMNKVHTIIANSSSYEEALNNSIDVLVSYNTFEAQTESENNQSQANRLVIITGGADALAVIFVVLIALWLTRQISRPLKKLMEASDKIAAGDMDIKLDLKRKDEFGKLNQSFGKLGAVVTTLIHDMNVLSEAAISGKLDIRADVSAYKGDYRTIVEGINNILDELLKPIKESTVVLKEVANGNLQVKVTGEYKGDHAEIKNALNATIENLEDYVSEISATLTQISVGNLDIEAVKEYKGDFRGISTALNTIIDSLNDIFSQINVAAEQVADGSQQVASASQSLSQGATEQASAIDELSSSITEIAQETKHNAENATQANRMALEARNDANTGNDQMMLMLKSMTDINESSSNISKIIKVIDEIAFQTNMLALNAAVEAARAGQYGKGFAVVAEEVRNLAARSANAVKETTALIEGTMQRVTNGTKISEESAKALVKIVDGVEKAANLVAEIAEASNEQSTGISQINLGVEQVSQVVQTNSATSEETAAASQELSSQAEILKEMIAKFSLRKNNSPVSSKEAARANPAETTYAQAASSKIKLSSKKSDDDSDFGKY